MADAGTLAAENVLLQKMLEKEVARRVEAERQRSEFAAAAKAARLERDAAVKSLQRSGPGVAKVLAEGLCQAATIKALKAELEEARRG